MTKDNEILINYIFDEINYIILKSKNLNFENVKNNETLKRALIWSLEVVGEASKNLPASFREKHSNIEWDEMISLRVELIKHYLNIDWNNIWYIIKNKIPVLKIKIENILKDVKKKLYLSDLYYQF